jgi:hypothetical protein
MLFNNSELEKIFVKYRILVSKLSITNNKDGGFPRYTDFILSPHEYSIINNNKELYLNKMAELKMLYLLLCVNMQSIYECFMIKLQPDIGDEENLSVLENMLFYSYSFICCYFLLVMPKLDTDFPLYLSKFETRDIRYIILNLLHGGLFTLIELIELNLFPIWGSLETNPSYASKEFYNIIKNPELLIGTKPNRSNLIFVELSLSEFFSVKELELFEPIEFELYTLSKTYIDDFSNNYNKLVFYKDKFLVLQKLIFVYSVLNQLKLFKTTSPTVEYSEYSFFLILLNIFNLSCIYLKKWFNDDLGFPEGSGESFIKLLLEIYGSSALFLYWYECYLTRFNSI